MYRCNKCLCKFEEPAEKEIYFEEYYGLTTLMGGKTLKNIYLCPNCNDEDIEELSKCELCGEWVQDDYIHDTTEMINGGVGWCCEQCIEDADMKEI